MHMREPTQRRMKIDQGHPDLLHSIIVVIATRFAKPTPALQKIAVGLARVAIVGEHSLLIDKANHGSNAIQVLSQHRLPQAAIAALVVMEIL
jgi:hypothetical protein